MEVCTFVLILDGEDKISKKHLQGGRSDSSLKN